MNKKNSLLVWILIITIIIISLAILIINFNKPEKNNEITPVYVTINSHNENTWNLSSEKKYNSYREDLLERLNILKEYDAKLNWQSDYTVLLSMQEYEKGSLLQQTNNKNILRYMVEDLNFSVDPHLHPNEYNYADIAYLIEQMGIEPSSVIGGIVIKECIDEEIEYTNWLETLELQDDGYVYGKKYSDYKWKPEILTGAGSPGHWFDDRSSGIWYPGNENEFYENQIDGQIIMFGQGYDHYKSLIGESQTSGAKLVYDDADYIKELIQKIKSGQLPAGKIYTANIHVRDSKIVSGTDVVTNEGLREILEELKPFADAGYIKYVTYQEGVDIWKDQYNSEPNIVDISEFSKYKEIILGEKIGCRKKL